MPDELTPEQLEVLALLERGRGPPAVYDQTPAPPKGAFSIPKPRPTVQMPVYTLGGGKPIMADQPLPPSVTSDVNPLAAAGASAVDPFGVTSGAIGMFSPETRDAMRNMYEEQPAASMVGSFMTPAGYFSKALEGARVAMAAAPKTATAALSALGITSSPSEAGLSQKQQRRLEMERERAKMGSEAERARIEAESKAANDARLGEVEAQRKTEENKIKLQLEGERQRQEFEQQQAVKASQTPFREKYPNLAAWLPAMGTAWLPC